MTDALTFGYEADPDPAIRVSFWRALRLLVATGWQVGPRLALAGVASEMAVSLGHIGTLYGTKLVVDGATSATLSQAMAGALLISVATGARQICSWADVALDLRERTAMRLEQRVVEVATRIPGIEHHERPELLDRLQLVREDRQRLGDVVTNLLGFMSVLASLLASSILLTTVHPALLLVMLAGLLSMAVSASVERRMAAAAEQAAQHHRLTLRLQEMVLDPKSAAELRLHRLAELVLTRHRQAATRVIDIENPASLVALAWDALGTMLFIAGQMVAIAAVALLGAQGRLTLGEVVLAIGLVQRAAGQLNAIIDGLSWLLRGMRAVKRLAWLIDESEAADRRARDLHPAPVPQRIEAGLRFVGVSFSYPGTEAEALHDVNLDLPAGTTIALVGENGAGKSTIIKLLLRLYDPTDGQVLLDGVDLRRLPIESWRARISGAFQDPARFELIAREVVGLGDLSRIEDIDAVHAAITDAGAEATVADLPHGLDTQLGPSFAEGIELSGGQWQLLALARAMMRQHPLLLVLDEPTAVLDPGREHALFERYAEAARLAATETGGITVLVSHRFSTVRMADTIAVIDGGRIVELGSHDQLIAQAGLYAELFALQARAYS